MHPELTARLRLVKGITGKPGTKDQYIEAFIAEVSDVISFEVFERMDDAYLSMSFHQWIKWRMNGLDEAQRRRGILNGVKVLIYKIPEEVEEPAAENVVSLFR